MAFTPLVSLANIGGGLRRSLTETPTNATTMLASRRAYHHTLRQFYNNTVYEDARIWQAYKSSYRLPRSIRSIYNPTRRAVDFYAGKVYGGAWTEDGKPLPDGTPHALPFPPDVLDDRPELIRAGMQFLNWGQWGTNRTLYVRETAMLGTGLVEIVDDLDKADVHPEIVPMERVANVTLDAMGNVKGYVLEYRAYDEDRDTQYDYKKVVTGESITEWRDRVVTREDENPYGFVPATWTKHRAALEPSGDTHPQLHRQAERSARRVLVGVGPFIHRTHRRQ
jgi:hypothetical protein